jgi:hypothetical protein
MDGINIYVVDDEGVEAPAVVSMFQDHGFDIVDDLYDADIVCFVGGEDVNPKLYKQHIHSHTYYNASRDEYEVEIYNEAVSLGIPMVGICRGGQFLNVMSGGSMWQDVDGHSGTHIARISDTKEEIEVTSVHHQMMDPDWNSNVKILLRAGMSTRKESMSSIESSSYGYSQFPMKGVWTDTEALWYPDSRCLCFQPHPEYGHEPTMNIFFKFLDEYIIAPTLVGTSSAA